MHTHACTRSVDAHRPRLRRPPVLAATAPPLLTPVGAERWELPHPLSSHVHVQCALARCQAPPLLLARPEDAAAVTAMHELLGETDRDGVWAELWPSALALARELSARPGLAAGCACAELGAGLALPTLAAASAGARRSLATDREPRALWCALAGAGANGFTAGPLPGGPSLPPLPGWPTPSSAARVDAALLDWTALEASLAAAEREGLAVRASFDVLLLADVLYLPGVHHVAAAVAALLAPGGRVLLADTSARAGKAGLRAAFLAALLAAGGGALEVAQTRRVVVEMAAPEADSNTGRLHSVELCLLGPPGWQPPP